MKIANKGVASVAAPLGEGGSSANPNMVLLAVGLAQFMAPLMLTSVGVALPSLGAELGASAVQLGLIEQLYVISLAIGMLTFGRWGDIIGQRRVFLPGLILFTLLTFSLGFTQSLTMIMFQRFFQGIGACMMLSGSLALVVKVFPPELRGRKIGVVSAFTYAGLSAGPVLGGYITQHFGWRYVFLMFVPLGVLATVICLMGMGNMEPNSKNDRMDWRGSVIYGVSVALIMLGASHAKSMPWGLMSIVLGLAGFVVFFKVQARTEHPLLHVNLLTKNRFFTLSCLAALGNYAATFGITFMMSLYLQYIKGLSPSDAGTLLIVQPILQIVISTAAGWLSDRHDPSKMATIGMLMSLVGLLATAFTLGMDTPLWLLISELCLIGSGFGVFVVPNSSAIMGSVGQHQLGLASGMIAAMRTLGMAVSMTSITLIFSIFLGELVVNAETASTFLLSMRVGLIVSAVLSSLGIFLSFLRTRK